LSLSASDPGADTLASWMIDWGDSNIETVAGNMTSVDHTYALDGEYSIAVQAMDEDGTYDAVPVVVTVVSPNLDPLAPGQFTQTDEDQPLVITLAATDPDGDPLIYSILSQPAFGTLGTLDPINHQLTYTPDPDYVGQVSFMFQVVDGQGGSATARINIDVLPVNDAPTLGVVADQMVVAGELLALALVGADVDGGDTLTYALVGGPAGMTVDDANGVLQWTAPFLDAIAVYPVMVRVSDGQGGEDQVSFNVTVDPDLLAVSSLEWTQTGYKVRFNQAVDMSTLNLVDDTLANRGPADALLADATGKPVPGSVVVDADAIGFTFVKSAGAAANGLLAAGVHNLALDSRANAFVDTHGRLLDGDNDGVAGGAFAATQIQTVDTSAVVLGLGEFARGPGQDVNLPAAGTGVPLRISNGQGVTNVSFTLQYDASLLTVTGVSSPLAGVTVTTDLSVAGQVGVQVSGISGLTNAPTDLLRLNADVPASAMTRYGASHVLDLRDVSVNGGALTVQDDDGLHVAAYLGDVTGDGA